MNKDLALVTEFLAGDRSPTRLNACSLQEALNGTLLELDPTQGASVLSFEPGQEFVQGGGSIQGGIVAAMLDFACVFAAFSRLPAGSSLGSTTLTVNYLRPALPGLLRTRGKIVKMGSRFLFAEAQIEAQDGKLAATATTVIAVVPG